MAGSLDKLVGALATQAAPDFFRQGFQAKYPGFITTQGKGSGYYNAMGEMEQRQFDAARASAVEADAEQASKTIVGMFITAAKLSGKHLTDEHIAKIQESARFHGRNIEAYIALARSMGLSENAINYIRQTFYGDKGSTAHLFDTNYNVMRSKVGSGAALRQTEQLASFQFGKYWDRTVTGGMNADDFATTHAFMIENGGFSGRNLASGQGLGLIDNRQITSYINRSGNKNLSTAQQVAGSYKEMYGSNTLQGHRNRQALRMASNAYLQELKSMDYEQLKRATAGEFSTDTLNAFGTLGELDKYMKNIKEDYRFSIDQNEEDVNKAKEKIRNQLDANIKKAKAANDTEAVKQLETYGNAIIKKMDDVYNTGVKTKGGKSVSAFRLAREGRAKLATVADRQVSELNKLYHANEVELQKAEAERSSLILSGESEGSDRMKKLNADIERLQSNKAALRDASPAGEYVYNLRKDTDLMNRDTAVNSVASQVKAAMAASGKPISAAEALQASKALMPLTAGTQELTAMAEHIGTQLSGVAARNGSVEQFLLQTASGREIAAQYGLSGVQASLVTGIGTNANKYAAENGLTDKNSQEVADKRARAAAKRARFGVQVATAADFAKNSETNGVLAKAKDRLSQEEFEQYQNLLAKAAKNPETMTEREGELFENLSNKTGITNFEMFDPKSFHAKRVASQHKETYELALNAGVTEEELTELSNKSNVKERFKYSDGNRIDDNTANEITRFMVKNHRKVKDILSARYANDEEKNRALQTYLKSQVDSGNLDGAAYERMSATLRDTEDNLGWQKFEEMYHERSGLGSDVDLDKAAAAITTGEQFKRDQELNRISYKGQAMFSAVDKNALPKLMDIVSSDRYRNASDEEKTKMLTEGFGTQLSTRQQKFLAFNLIKDDKLRAGGKFKNERGQVFQLKNKDLEIARFAVEHPEEFKKRMDNARQERNGKVDINGEKYSVQQINQSIRHAENAAAQTVGLNQADANKNFKINEVSDEEKFFSEEAQNKDLADKRALIKASLKRVKKLTKSGYNNAAYDEFNEKGAKEDEILDRMVDNVIADPSRAAEYGIDSLENIAERERRVLENSKRKQRNEAISDPNKKEELLDVNNLDNVSASDEVGAAAQKAKKEAESNKLAQDTLNTNVEMNKSLQKIANTLESIKGLM